MAQSGFTPILLYGSSTASTAPLAANLTSSTSGVELALNYTDGKLYYKDSGGVVQLLASKASAAGVLSFQTSLSGLTPSTATNGVVTLAGTLGVASGGTGITSFGTGIATWLGTPTSANLSAAITDETGTGLLMFNNAPAVTNPTVTNYVETLFTATGNTSVTLSNGTIQKITTSGATTITLPSSVSGKSFTVIVSYAAADTLTWAGGSTLKWAGGTTPTPTSATGKIDIFNFYQDGTNTYGAIYGQNY